MPVIQIPGTERVTAFNPGSRQETLLTLKLCCIAGAAHTAGGKEYVPATKGQRQRSLLKSLFAVYLCVNVRVREDEIPAAQKQLGMIKTHQDATSDK